MVKYLVNVFPTVLVSLKKDLQMKKFPEVEVSTGMVKNG